MALEASSLRSQQAQLTCLLIVRNTLPVRGPLAGREQAWRGRGAKRGREHKPVSTQMQVGNVGGTTSPGSRDARMGPCSLPQQSEETVDFVVDFWRVANDQRGRQGPRDDAPNRTRLSHPLPPIGSALAAYLNRAAYRFAISLAGLNAGPVCSSNSSVGRGLRLGDRPRTAAWRLRLESWAIRVDSASGPGRLAEQRRTRLVGANRQATMTTDSVERLGDPCVTNSWLAAKSAWAGRF